MHLVISGEGKTDIGMFSYEKGEFIAGSMYYFIDKIIEKKYDFSYYDCCPEAITFVPKSQLIEICKKMTSFAGKKRPQETAFFFKNAKGLAQIAKEKCVEKDDDHVIAILFRDADGTSSTPKSEWEQKVKAIENGFEQENINGVAMIPNPKSEAWLICALKKNPYLHCAILEERSGNDDSPNSLKKEFKQLLNDHTIDYAELNRRIKENTITIDAIDMPSYRRFEKKLTDLLYP